MTNNPFSDPRNPYQASYAAGIPAKQFPPGERPPVVTWWVVYCSLMAFLYVLLAAMGAMLFVLPTIEDVGRDEAVLYVQGVVFLVMGIVLFLAFGAAPLLPRSKFTWIYGIVTICLGLTSRCTLPFCIPLLIFWLKPEVKAYLNAM